MLISALQHVRKFFLDPNAYLVHGFSSSSPCKPSTKCESRVGVTAIRLHVPVSAKNLIQVGIALVAKKTPSLTEICSHDSDWFGRQHAPKRASILSTVGYQVDPVCTKSSTTSPRVAGGKAIASRNLESSLRCLRQGLRREDVPVTTIWFSLQRSRGYRIQA